MASLEKMIALIATLVEKSRDDSNELRLSVNDWTALTGKVCCTLKYVLGKCGGEILCQF